MGTIKDIHSLTVRTLVRLASTPEEELEEARLRDAQRKPGDPLPFPLLYTMRLKNAGKDVFGGKGLAAAYLRVNTFNEALQLKARSVIDGFQHIIDANPSIDFTRKPTPKDCFGIIGGTALKMSPDSIGTSETGKPLFMFFHVVDAPRTDEAVHLLLHAAQYVADARALDAEVALVDAPRRRLLRLTEEVQEEVVIAALRDVLGQIQN
ncbi:hypothetical protein [Arenimonas sp.]|uniref:hypothetical protein n=1 Tax=Arenimonas sp. TaxID=1872635 RepID=UPI002E316896|nr:hypothetical protein [Arenimonas sp.]HEX4853053.1 hypothetical protein [Arenimonas sp.]